MRQSPGRMPAPVRSMTGCNYHCTYRPPQIRTEPVRKPERLRVWKVNSGDNQDSRQYRVGGLHCRVGDVHAREVPVRGSYRSRPEASARRVGFADFRHSVPGPGILLRPLPSSILSRILGNPRRFGHARIERHRERLSRFLRRIGRNFLGHAQLLGLDRPGAIANTLLVK
jgi:hypothetical protein